MTYLLLKYYAISVVIVTLVNLILLMICKFFNEKKFIEICNRYKNEVGPLPAFTVALMNASWLAQPVMNLAKKDFILKPLYKHKISKWSNNERDIEFVEKSPANLIKSFFLERTLTRSLGIMLLFCSSITFLDKLC
ncbi:hypothetical protein [Huaxiibacter chinensis]|uniref:hypothetical protein n=1 Tax=Huaxiibacter chinensis TaxID=2899785 RepID=UPI003D316D20